MNDATPTHIRPAERAQTYDLATVRHGVDRQLETIYAEAARRAATIDPLCHDLIEDLRRASLAGGKRLRPYLTYLSYVGHGGHDAAAALAVATSQELYHHAWLLHDDVMDGDMTRHGQLNLIGTYYGQLSGPEPQRRKTAESAGIIGGDILMALAAGHFMTAALPPRRLSEAFVALQTTFSDLANGQMLDILAPLLPEDDQTASRLLKVCHYKTASYSFEAPLVLGAILAGASPERIGASTAFAIPLGIGYQLRDDMLAIFGDDEEVGKPGISDLREGKLTVMMHDALASARPDDRDRLRGILGHRDADSADLATARTILEACGARQRAEQAIARYEDMARQALPALGLGDGPKGALEGLVGRLQGRRS